MAKSTRTGSVFFGNQWSTTWNSNSSSNYSNRMYIGKQANNEIRRYKVKINTDGLIISSASELIIKAKVKESDYSLNYLKARLSRSNIDANKYYGDSGDPSDALKDITIGTSSAYEDTEKTAVSSSKYDSGSVLYFIFDVSSAKIKSNEDLIIYFAQEKSTSVFSCIEIDTITLEHEEYTKCGAPTSVTISSVVGDTVTKNGIIKPSGNKIKISWFGAQAGNGMSIKEYQVYYRITSGGSAPTTSTFSGNKTIETTSSSGSTTFEIDGASRGYKIVAGVITVGSKSGYNSSIKTGGTVTINTKPKSPTVSVSKTSILASTEKGVTFTITAGSDEDTQTKSLYYSTSNNTDKKVINNNTLSGTVDEGKSITYNFYTYDGLEYSSATAKTITRNSKPSVSISVSGSVVTGAKAKSTYPYVISPKITATKGSNGQSSGNKYKFVIKYGTEASNLSSTKTLANQTSSSFTVKDVRDIIGHNKYYKLYVTRNDGIEDSDTVKSDKTYYIPEIPKLLNFYNQSNSKNTALSDYFHEKLRLYLEQDEGYDTFILTGEKVNSEKYEAQSDIKTTSYENQMRLEFNCSEWGQGSKYTFTLEAKNSSTGYSTSIDLKGKWLTKIYVDNKNLNLQWTGTVNPFTSLDVSLTFRNFFNEIKVVNDKKIISDSTLNLYGFNENPIFTITSAYGGKSNWTTRTTNYTDKDNAYLSLAKKSVYNLFEIGLDKVTDKDQKTTITISTTNEFGVLYEDKMDKFVNYYHADLIPKVTVKGNLSFKYKIKIGTETTTYSDATGPLMENVIPCLSGLMVESYYGPPVKIKVTATRNGIKFYEGSISSFTSSGTGSLGNSSPIKYAISNIDFPSLGEQKTLIMGEKDTSFEITVILKNNLEEDYTLTTGKQVRRHVKGAGEITVGEYSDEGDGKMQITCNVSDFGINSNTSSSGTAYIARLYYKDPIMESFEQLGFINASTSKLITNEKTNTNFETTNETVKVGFQTKDFLGTMPDYITVYIEFETVSYILADEQTRIFNTKSFRTKEMVIYNIKPTVAYRKNKIGINYDFPESSSYTDGAIVVNSHTQKSKIYFIEAGKNRYLDISTGNLNGFIINGGTWG